MMTSRLKICSTVRKPDLKPAGSSASSSSALVLSSKHDLAGMADQADGTKVLMLLEVAFLE